MVRLSYWQCKDILWRKAYLLVMKLRHTRSREARQTRHVRQLVLQSFSHSLMQFATTTSSVILPAQNSLTTQDCIMANSTTILQIRSSLQKFRLAVISDSTACSLMERS